ncbi:MAG: DNA-binding response regulator [Rhodocyclales bacterium]|nr:DNA-binding response regulator [Rhodocyclales bacterium]
MSTADRFGAMSSKIRVLIADDHAIIRQGLKQILSDTEDLEVVAEADGGVKALQVLRNTQCDVVLMDVSMPDRNGIDTLKLVKKEFPRLPVLILSMHPEEQYAVRALRAGAAGYLSKQGAPEQLVTAIRQVAAGKKYVSAAVAEELANVIGEDVERPPHEKLSDREYQTLCMISSGKTLTQIAEQLNLSVKTVSVYRARLLEKMKLRNNAELTHYGLKHGLVE